MTVCLNAVGNVKFVFSIVAAAHCDSYVAAAHCDSSAMKEWISNVAILMGFASSNFAYNYVEKVFHSISYTTISVFRMRDNKCERHTLEHKRDKVVVVGFVPILGKRKLFLFSDLRMILFSRELPDFPFSICSKKLSHIFTTENG